MILQHGHEYYCTSLAMRVIFLRYDTAGMAMVQDASWNGAMNADIALVASAVFLAVLLGMAIGFWAAGGRGKR